MAETPTAPTVDAPKSGENGPGQPGQRSKEDIALELMKFVATVTGYGKGQTSAGFSGKSATRTPEEHAEALLNLYERCRTLVGK